MNTYMEIMNGKGRKEYCYAAVYFEDQQLRLAIPQGLIKVDRKTIDLGEIQYLRRFSILGGETIEFQVSDTHYTFFESGKGVVEYLRENLVI